MLRIHVHEKAGVATLRVEGRLAGPWVAELERCWESVLARLGNQHLIVELDCLSFVDAQGQFLLQQMSRGGAELIGRGAQCRHLAEEIRQQTLVSQRRPLVESG